MELGAHEARAQCLHPHARAGEATGQPFGERHDIGLAAGVGGTATGQQTGHARDVDDVAPARLDHRRERGAGERDDRGDVDVELRLQQARIGGPELAGRAEAGVVDEHLDTATEAFDDEIATVDGRQIGDDDLRCRPELLLQLGGEFVEGGTGAGDEHEVVTATREGAGETRTDSRGGSGHERDGADGSHGRHTNDTRRARPPPEDLPQ